MTMRLLISGDRPHFTTLSFDPNTSTLSIDTNYPGQYNASWAEPESSVAGVDRLIGLSEGEEAGLLYTFEINHAKKSLTITSQQPTLGAPAHFTTLHDESALALGTYLGGSIALYPIQVTEDKGLLLDNVPREEFLPEFPYDKHGANIGRQRQCHVHQVLEDKNGLLYAPDLGADRVWIFRRDRMKLDLCGWLQCPAGTGARHAVFSHDGNLFYVLGELSHAIVAFDLSQGPGSDIRPIEGFNPNIIPPSVHAEHQFMMDSAELCLHPNIPNVLYASNRWERHIAEREPHLTGVPDVPPKGDAIAIILLSDDGRKTESITFIRSGLDTIRGMRFSADGKYIAAVGQEGGGVEIYSVGGERGDKWTLAAKLDEVLDNGIKHVVWL